DRAARLRLVFKSGGKSRAGGPEDTDFPSPPQTSLHGLKGGCRSSVSSFRRRARPQRFAAFRRRHAGRRAEGMVVTRIGRSSPKIFRWRDKRCDCHPTKGGRAVPQCDGTALCPALCLSCGTTLERIAPESLTRSLSEFVHGNM